MGNEPFIRISWEEAFNELTKALNQKYDVDGALTFKKDYGTEGIGNMYDYPDFVDIHFDNNMRGKRFLSSVGMDHIKKGDH